MVRRVIAIGCILSVLLGIPASVGARPSAAQRCFAETGKCVEGRFLDYWNAHGGLAINGFPLSDERQEQIGGTTYTVQWFERVRMEYHPEYAGTSSEVLLGQFGRAIHPADPPVARKPGALFFEPTGHNVTRSAFVDYWNANGGLPQFGYALTEEIDETLGGQNYRVQYFERARFEWHPENAFPFNVLLGQFGRQLLNAPWGPVLAPLASNYTTYRDPQGRYTVRVPQDWTQRQDAPPSVFFRKPGPLWGAEIALNDGAAFTSVEQVDPIIGQQLQDWLKDYKPLIHDKVNVGTHQAYRRVFQHTNVEGQTEIIVRIYFLSGPWLVQVNGFMLPDQRATVQPLVEGLAGSIVAP